MIDEDKLSTQARVWRRVTTGGANRPGAIRADLRAGDRRPLAGSEALRATPPEPVLRGGRLLGEWLDRAACRGMDPRLFDHGEHTAQDLGRRREAAKVCAGCPVQVECRAAGQGASGVWGGSSNGNVERTATKRPSRAKKGAKAA